MNRKPQQLTLTFQNPNASSSAVKHEEADYVNAAVSTVDKMPAIVDKKPHSLTQSIATIAVGWVILSVTLALDIYFTSVISENNTKLTAENQNLATQNQELESRKKDLKSQKQELESERNNLKQQIHNMTTERTELNVTRAQWTIDTYCPIKEDRRQCEACEKGWLHNESSCYGVLYLTDPNDWRNWTEARENCRGKISDLVVIVDEKAKTFVSDNSWISSGNKGYWIGLRVEDGRWKWVDGSDLTESSWIKPPEEGRCAISVQGEGWKSVSCSERNRWVCGKAALSV
ncbi:C-type lectin domain family 4 member M-like [Trachinotus anak]|uniref:C-type lectin domain family 4 member M-like n=1 Tax=Trachinotus anak TaxID=443729 RepID=UPI0039F16EAC